VNDLGKPIYEEADEKRRRAMREKHLQRFVDQLEMAVDDIVSQSRVRKSRRRLAEEEIQDAMHFMTAVLDGMTETDYARQHPEIYERLCAAVRLEEALASPARP
jgi:hypothetical protein